MRSCVLCKGRQIGKIGRDRYYCSECYHEWTDGERGVQLFTIFPDGAVKRVMGKCIGKENWVSRRGAG